MQRYVLEQGQMQSQVFKRDIGGTTELKRLQTPINLFEDECIFCHSFRTDEEIHGPMVCYLKGRLVFIEEGNLSKVIYVHKKCLMWWGSVFCSNIVENLESEIRRASRLRCARCGLQGAALGCYYKHCRKSFHIPCAVQIIDCRWDVDKRNVLCPKHVSKTLPCDKLSTHTKENDHSSSLRQSQHSDEEGISKNHERDDQQTHKRNTSNFPSLPKSCHPDEEGISNVYKREEIKAYRADTSSCPSDQMVLLGLSLSASEKDSLQEFVRWSNGKLTKEWDKNVTHVIVGKGPGSSWNRSFEVLMAVLLGKWVIHFEWIMDCSSEMRPRPEASYEVTSSMDSLKTMDGPKKGRIRAATGAPNLFSGLHFCLSAYMNPDGRHRVRDLIAAAGGKVLEGGFLDPPLECFDGSSSVKPYFVFDGDVPGEFALGTLLKEVEEARKHAAAGARVISHQRVLDAVAAYDAEILNR
uniref:PHD-type domain-containing protein n=1 Tax=Setaria italica TaxID=4555 RepID=K3Z602_SETIT